LLRYSYSNRMGGLEKYQQMLNAEFMEHNLLRTNEQSQQPAAAQSDSWLTREDLAERLKLPKSTLNQWACRGLGPRYAVFGRHARYRLSDVIAWEESQFSGGDAA
jgi:hypothetical protein